MTRIWLSALEISNLRNLRQATLVPGQGINVFEGPNGSGKTSLLEAIHLLAVGRSFQSSQASTYIRFDEKKVTVFGRLGGDARVSRIGIEKDQQGNTEIRVDGTKPSGAAALAEHLPVILITPESHEVIGGGPGERRALLDWGLFHVEQEFFALWRRYQRYLKQRNAALAGGSSLAQWNEGLSQSGEQLSARRQAYVEGLQPRLAAVLSQLSPTLPSVEMEYQPGWAADLGLGEALLRSEERDRREGYTHVGPHRAELRIRLAGRRASEVLSRGQEKIVLSGLRLAQLADLRERTGKSAVVLIDDLPAELDAGHRARFLQLLGQMEAQVFVTATDLSLLDLSNQPIPPQVFHVEHGTVRAML